ncbi:UNVERIFIED_ORG: hypothetical protein CLV66_101526 [Actinomadura viridilutea]|nr:hypothetical protein [Actinomadura rubrobrunea]
MSEPGRRGAAWTAARTDGVRRGASVGERRRRVAAEASGDAG